MKARSTGLWVSLVGAALGMFFASFSTYDFAEHLDRQTHDLHCSFIPGIAGRPEAAGTGCHVTLMSPYSSVMRSSVWGGVPVSMPAISVFAFIAFWSLYLMITKRGGDRRGTFFLLLATALPLVTSLVMGFISFTKLGAACKLCIGIYVSSLVVFIGATMARRASAQVAAMKSAGGAADETVPADAYDPRMDTPISIGALAGAFVLGLAFVFVPVVVYASTLPNYERYIGQCGALEHTGDPQGIMVSIDGSSTGGTEAIEVLDPLCPSCKAFEQRLQASGLAPRLNRKAVLFPLDNTCNWMLSHAEHPGACTVSEAVLCAGDNAREVLDWAFAEQDRIREATSHDPAAAARMVRERFPNLSSCVGSAPIRNKLSRSLRWAVSNHLQVLTPQLFVGGVKLCDEDSDLGMDYALSHMLDRRTGAH